MSTQSIPDDEGGIRARLARLLRYTRNITAAEVVTGRLAAATRETIREFQRERELAVTGSLNEETSSALAQAPGVRPDRFWVAGRVALADGSPASGFTVRAADLDLRRELQLGQVLTDEGGFYLIDYTREQFGRAEKGSADLLIRVARGQRVVRDPGLAAVVFNAPALAVVNIDLAETDLYGTDLDSTAGGAGGRRPETEFEMILRTLVPLLDGLPLAELREDEEVHDVLFLAAETGIAGYRIAYFGLAQRLAAARQLPAAFCYALFVEDTVLRSGGASGVRNYVDLSAALDPLYFDIVLLPSDVVWQAITKAVNTLIVPQSVADDLDQLMAHLAGDASAARAYLRAQRPATLMAAAAPLLTSGAIGRVVALLDLDSGGDLNSLLTQIQEELIRTPDPDATVFSPDPAMLGVLGLDGEAMDRIREQHGITDGDSYRLASLTTADWTAALGNRPQAWLHAAALTDRMAARFPTAALAANLSRDGSAMGGHGVAMSNFFQAHPNLDFNTANLDVLLRSDSSTSDSSNKGSSDSGSSDTNADSDAAQGRPPTAALKAMQRLFRLAPTYAQTSALLNSGISSAAQIHTMGLRRFQQATALTGVFTPQQTQVAYSKAVHIHIAATMLAGQMQALPAATAVAGLSAPLPAGTLAKVGADFPNFKSLFGTGDVCACDECRSIHSAAAYLVDVLQFLKHRAVVDSTGPGGDQHIAKAVLLQRRPDLGDTDLNCANTNTPLPYLDLVCELLEEAIAPDPGFTYTGSLAVDTNAAGEQIGPVDAGLLSALQARGLTFTDASIVFPTDVAGTQVVRDASVVAKLTPSGGSWQVREMRQTYGSEAELAAAPKYVNQTAYQLLAISPIAFGLPFDLAHTEAGSFLTQAGVPRADLMRALQVAGVPSDGAIAAEAWGLTAAELALVVTPDPSAQQTIWSTAGPAATAMATVSTFLGRTDMTYQDLQQLLSLQWLNPSAALGITHTTAGCDLSTQNISGLDDNALDRFHRFIRLWRATGWAPATVDRVIRAPQLGNGALDEICVVATSEVQNVADRLGIDIDVAIDLYDDLPWEGEDSRYARQFLNKAAVGLVPDALRPAQVTASAGATPLSKYTAYLALCLGLSTDDLTALAGTLPSGELNHHNISGLAALRQLALAMKLAASELLITFGLTGLTPLTSPAETLKFLAALTCIRTANTTPTELRYLLRHEADDLTAREMAAATISGSLTRLQTAYRAARITGAWLAAASDPLGEQREALAAALAAVPGWSTSDVGAIMSIVDGTWADPDTSAAALLTDKFADSVEAGMLTAILGKVAAAPTDAQRIGLIQEIGADLSASAYTRDKAAILMAEVATVMASTTALATAALSAKLAAAGGRRLSDVLTDEVITGPDGSPTPTITPAAYDDQFRALRLLKSMLALAGGFALTAVQMSWMLTANATLGWLVLDELPYQSGIAPIGFAPWRRLADGVAFDSAYPPVTNPSTPTVPYSGSGLFDLVRMSAPLSGVVNYVSALTGWDASTAQELAALLTMVSADFADPATVGRLGKALTLVRTVGVSVAEAAALMAPMLTPTDVAALKLALKAGYADADWLGVLRNITDRLRIGKRDALVSYLLAVNPQLTTADDLFDNFLIDVQMSPCMPTSRIVQAHGTVQLFIQRCLMGIEPTCVADVGGDSGWAQWEWMSQFRVWEVNRKIFLWPENIMFAGVRDDKSEQYQALQNTLAQNPLTTTAVEDATAGYLEGLDDIAHLEVMASYYQTATGVMHVFARTRDGDGRTYLHRQFIKERAWTPWQRVKLDITGNHLTAFERHGRLALAWPMFSFDAHTDKQFNLSEPMPSGPTPPAEKRMNIQICVSEFANGRWRGKKVSQHPVMYPADGSYTTNSLPDVDSLNFIVTDLGAAGQSIICLAADGASIGGFSLTGCKGYPEPLPYVSGSYLIYPRYLNAGFGTEKHLLDPSDSGSELTERNYLLGADLKILDRTSRPGLFEITHPLQFTQNDLILYLLRELLGGGGKPSYLAATDQQRYRVPLPVGSLMPYFYGDYDRGYVIVPGLYPRPVYTRAVPPDQPSGDRTYSDLSKFLDDVRALLRTYLALYATDKDLKDVVDKLAADPEFKRLRDYGIDLSKRRYGVRFENFYHPLVCALRMALDSGGVDGLMRREIQLQQTAFDFAASFKPTGVVIRPYPVEDIDFTLGGAYSSYNWELFFHLPYEIASRLSNDQQFAAARDWLHYIFNPVGVIDAAASGPPAVAPAKYWITKPFFKRTPADYAVELIDAISNRIALDPEALHIDDLVFAVDQWRDKPFSPFVVARSRTVAFQLATVRAYVQNLVDWADSELIKFTRESVVTATQLYLMAEKLLGVKPQVVPPEFEAPTQTYNQLEATIDIFGNALVDVENLIPGWEPVTGPLDPWMPAPISAVSLYFCIPQNEELLGLWDLVADRLFKIRHCQNIDGIPSPLALFAPPIDPGALVRALAAGGSLSSVLAGLGAPPPYYRFVVMTQKATELIGQVASLGSQLLSALEKRDGEALAQLRTRQEQIVLNAVRTVKSDALTEANGAIDALTKSKAITQTRRDFYASQQFMNDNEQTSADINQDIAIGQGVLTAGYILAGVLTSVPDFMIGVAGFGGSPAANVTTGGTKFGSATELGTKAGSSLLQVLERTAALNATQGAYHRRADEWGLQVSLADKELTQLDQQIANAKLHVLMLTDDITAQDKQISNAADMLAYFNDKYTNEELYEWMIGEISGVYFDSYKLAFDTAKKAERCFEHELGSQAGFVNGPYWDSLRMGLQAAEPLLHDIKRMEIAYLDRNKRELELTKHVSLAQLDPAALLALRSTGSCDFQVPELAYDLDFPGHYFRRLKSVSLSLPCVVGPYTTVNATLSLVSNKYRAKTTLPSSGTPAAKYAEVPTGDDRFVYNVGSIQSIATSTAVADSGMFELNFHDERYLPFEGCGALSRWHLELPTQFRQFDYDSISDVLLHVRYTARADSGLKKAAGDALTALINDFAHAVGASGLYQALSLDEQFPDAWWQLRQTQVTSMTFTPTHLPYWTRSRTPVIHSVTWYVSIPGAPIAPELTVGGIAAPLKPATGLPGVYLAVTTTGLALGAPIAFAMNIPAATEVVAMVKYTVS